MVEILVFNWMAMGRDDWQQFGTSVASAGDVNGDGFDDVIAGSPGWGTLAGLSDAEGRADVFFGSATGLAKTADWTRRADQPGFGEDPRYGSSVASAGDVNGDGFDDIIVGAPNEDLAPLENGAGAAFLYYGSPSGPSRTEDWRETGTMFDESFGSRVASAGDVNGDGFDDVLVGAPGFHDKQDGEGRVLLYLGSPSGLTTKAWVVEGNDADAGVGNVVGCAGDVNGDGYDDILLTSRVFVNHEFLLTGRLVVFHGSPTGPRLEADTVIVGDEPGWVYGIAASAAGDVNGDGFDDVAVSAIDGGYANTEGRVFVYFGSAAGLETTPTWVAVGRTDKGYGGFGSALGSLGDVNGDGFDDLAIGSPYFDSVPSDLQQEGRALVFLGSDGGLETAPAWVMTGKTNEILGESVGSPVDVNGDGLGDLLFSSFATHYGPLIGGGRAYLFLATGP